MGLYDVIDEISKGSVTKTETGDVRITGVLVGRVTKNFSKDFPGRVCVKIPVRGANNKDADLLKWARVASFYMGKNWGELFMPEVGDEVLLVFEQGNIEKPYVIGAIPNCKGGTSSKLLDGRDENNTIKKIQTKHGSNITFTDGEPEKGEKDKILIETAGEKKHSILLDNENQKIVIKDEKAENSITLDTKEDGRITAKATKNISLLVGANGDKCKIEMNGDSGTVTITADSILLKTKSGNISLESSNGLQLKGSGAANIETNSFKVQSTSSLTLSGAMVQVGKS